jgi:hypothetical protein
MLRSKLLPISKSVTAIVGVFVVAIFVGLAFFISRPIGQAVSNVSFGSVEISPNADGKNDITTISYQVWRDVKVSIYFVNKSGRRFYFRQDETRTWGEYSVLFSGIVDGFVLDGESFKGNVLTRLMPDGEYEWVVEALDVATGNTERTTGELTVQGSDSIVPDIQEFTISPEVFTPNQDGLDDRVWINTFVPKPAQLTVYLVDNSGKQYFVPESQQSRIPGEEGRHSFEYEGGVDLGISPPSDGTYTVLVESKDDEGQRVQASGQVTIKDGGVPLAEIVAQPVGDTLIVNSEAIKIGELLTFEVTVENYGDAPIRTTGPAPAFTYEQDQTYPSTGFFEESGAWRVGINCDTCLTDYPWRWALGTTQTLTAIKGSDGRTHYYLMPGERVVVTGSIRLTNIVPSRNPQQFWAGLIHEDVGIAPLNNRVDPHWIEIFTDEPLFTPTAGP